MKKLFSLFSLVVLIGISVNVMGQGTVNQTLGVNATRTYTVNATPGVHAGNSYVWVVLPWNGTDDYSLQAFAPTALTAGTEFNFTTAATGVDKNRVGINWLLSGHYVVQVTETGSGTGCTTVRRFGVSVIQLDLLVTTLQSDGTTEIPTAYTGCNTDAGGVWTNDDNTDLNNPTGVTPALGNTVFKYKIQLFTKDGSIASGDNIATSFPAATWEFTPTVTNTTPSGGSVSWSYGTGATGTVNNPITVTAATSEVILTLTLKNIAGDEALQYINNLTIANSSVKIDLAGGSAFNDGSESSTNTNSNDGKQITINPIPNTSTISSN